jgi:hypothetical protein
MMQEVPILRAFFEVGRDRPSHFRSTNMTTTPEHSKLSAVGKMIRQLEARAWKSPEGARGGSAPPKARTVEEAWRTAISHEPCGRIIRSS